MYDRFMIVIKKKDWTANIQPHNLCNHWTIGNINCDIVVPDCAYTALSMRVGINGITVRVEDGHFKETPEHNLIIPINAQSRFHVLSPDYEEAFSITIYPETKNRYLENNLFIQIPEGKPVLVGRASNANIRINHPLIAEQLFIIQRHNNTWNIKPVSQIPLGLFLNATRINSTAQATDGDFLTCFAFQFLITETELVLISDAEIQIFNLQYNNEKADVGYPCLNRSPRRILNKPADPIQLQDPPAAPQENKGNIVISLIPIAIMVLLTVFLRGQVSSDSSMLLYSVLTMTVGGVGSILAYIQTGKEYRKQKTKRNEEYRKYISESEIKIQQLRKKEHDILSELYINQEEEINRALSFSSYIYDRRPEDEDFLDIRLGYGRIRSNQKVVYSQHEVFEQTDDLYALPKNLSDRYEFSDDLPVYLHGISTNAAGIIGGKSELADILKIIILDISIRQYSKDVSIFAFLPSFYQDELQSIRLLPHFNNLETGHRSLAYDEESISFLTERLYKEIAGREPLINTTHEAPWIVAIISTELTNVMRHPLIDFVATAAKYHVLFIFLSENKALLPQGCSTVTSLMSNTSMGLVAYMNTSNFEQLFSYDRVPTDKLITVSEKMAPVYCGDSLLSTRLTGNETLFDILQIHSINELHIAENWNHFDSTRSLAAPIGIRDNGEILYLDLHENAHGPHGLVAGTTGSGKSQVLISYILSLSTMYSPDDVTFAVIDFKGGDIVKQLPGLPHIVGSITNIEKNEIERSLRSINAEKNRRMILFDQDHANVSNISEYTQAYRNGKVSQPLPHLFIIVDEFAELKSQYPDFLSALISFARVGRSLGIHLILCTQKPGGGVVDPQIWSNSNFKLCLRVQNREDSNDVLHSPLAAEIRERGRGYLQAEPGLFELFQSGYSGTSADTQNTNEQPITISQVDLAGRTSVLYQKKGAAQKSSNKTQREAVLESIIRAFRESKKQLPVPLCQPSIPVVLPYESIKANQFGTIPIGLLDDPDNQAIYPLCIDLIGKNTLIVGNSQMGKTNLLVVLLRWIAENTTPSDIIVYAIDYNTYSLKAMQDLSCIGGVITEREEERLKNLIKMLYKEIAQRRQRFDSAKAQNYSAYRQGHNDLPIIVIMIDNYAVLHELYNEQYGNDIVNLIRDCTSYGITFLLTVQHISSLSYKLSYFFSQRIAMYLSERADYSSVFDGCRTSVPETPGRVLVSMNKSFYEGQVFDAFPGSNEAQKANMLKLFINEHSSGPRARAIPGVPDHLNYAYIKANYSDLMNNNSVIIGVDYDNIEPVTIRMGIDFSLALLGGTEQERLSVTNMIIRNAVNQLNGPQIYIFDDAMRPLRAYRSNPYISKYTCTVEEIDALLNEISNELEQRKEKAMINDDIIDHFKPIIVVVNSEELLRVISDNASLISMYHHIAEDLFRMKAFFLFSEFPNKLIRYNSPELIRLISEERNALILNDLSAVKAFDINGSTVRNQGRPIGPNEAFMLKSDDVLRMKLLSNE